MKKLYTEMTASDWKQIGHAHGETDTKHCGGTTHNYVCRECGEILGTLYNGDEPVVEWHNVGANIRSARDAAGLSQKALADKMRIGQARIADWEGGKKDPKASSLFAIADALGIEPGELLK